MRAESQRLEHRLVAPLRRHRRRALGAIMSTLGTRVTTLGLADLRGGLHVGFDEGAWMTTVSASDKCSLACVVPTSAASWGFAGSFSIGIVVFFTSSLLAPIVPESNRVLRDAIPRGVGSGTFIPLSMGFIARSLPARVDHLRDRDHRDEFRALAERVGVVGRLVL